MTVGLAGAVYIKWLQILARRPGGEIGQHNSLRLSLGSLAGLDDVQHHSPAAQAEAQYGAGAGGGGWPRGEEAGCAHLTDAPLTHNLGAVSFIFFFMLIAFIGGNKRI